MNVIFFAVDCQKDFCLPTGKLYIKGAEEINDNLQKLTEFAEINKLSVINTADYHTSKSMEIIGKPDFITIFPPHCMAGELGQEFIKQTYPQEFPGDYYIINPNDERLDTWDLTCSRNIILFKDVFDVFEGNKHTDGVLKYLEPDLVVVYGVVSEVCVNFAVLGLLKRDYNVVVVIDAIKALNSSPINIYNLYQDWLMRGAWLANVESIKKFITERREESEDFR